MTALPPPVPLVAQMARAYTGVRWRHLGRDRLGLDCVGLILVALRDAGLPTSEPDGPYAKGERGEALIAAVGARGVRVPLLDAVDGDVLAFSGGRYVAHLGIRATLYGQPSVIHAHAGRHLVMEELLLHQIAAALRSAWRPRAPGDA